MGHALAASEAASTHPSSSPIIEDERPPPQHPGAVATHAFDPHDREQAKGASLAFGHLVDDGGRQSSPGLAAPPCFDLGDVAVGTTQFSNLLVFNTEAYDAAVRVGYEGSSSVTLIGAPDRLRPSRDGFDPQTAIRLAFAPAAKGHHDGAIIIHTAWQAGERAPEQLRIPVRAAAHEIGQPDIADEEADQRVREQQEAGDGRDRAEMDRAKATREARLKRGETSGNAATREALHEASDDAMQAMTLLLQTRNVGVEAAEAEAAAYVQKTPPYHESLLHALAFAALDVVTAGLAGSLAKRLEGVLLEKLSVPARKVWSSGRELQEHVHDPGKAVVAFFTDGVKDVVKQTGKAARPHGAHSAERELEQDEAGNSRIEFFKREKLALIKQGASAAQTATTHARYALEPMLDTAPDRAIAAMRAISEQLAQAAVEEKAANTQQRESALHWMRYVAETSLGSIDAATGRAEGKRTAKDGTATTDIAAANAAPNEHGAPSRHAGLVDIEFAADILHAERPVTVSHVRVDGVSNAIARHLKHQPLLTSGVAVRAYATPTARDVSGTLEAIRDEAGNVDCADNTGVPGMSGHWFARKAGAPQGGRDAALRGARIVLDEAAREVDARLHSVGRDHLDVETDSDD